jgi:hypothetical protein
VKPYVSAMTAARMLGVPVETVVADIAGGMDGNLVSLIGAPAGGVYVIPSWELEGERLEMHRARLRADGDSAAMPTDEASDD